MLITIKNIKKLFYHYNTHLQNNDRLSMYIYLYRAYCYLSSHLRSAFRQTNYIYPLIYKVFFLQIHVISYLSIHRRTQNRQPIYKYLNHVSFLLHIILHIQIHQPILQPHAHLVNHLSNIHYILLHYYVNIHRIHLLYHPPIHL